MTLPASGYLLLGSDGGASGRSINSEFGYGNDLASYQGVYYGRGGSEYRFPVPGNSLAMDAFYSAYKIVPGSQTFNSSQNYVIPVYNTLTVTVHGGNGGQSGSFGYSSCGSYIGPTQSGNGGNGNASSFGGYLSAGGGSGGGGNAVSGGSGTTSTSSFTNPVQGGAGPSSGSTVYVTIGSGGAGGTGGTNFFILNGICAGWNKASSGSSGAAGYVTISWA